MRIEFEKIKLSNVLTERGQKILPEEVTLKGLPIIAKIGFNNGLIDLRESSNSKTEMILVEPGDLVISGINAAKGAIGIYGKENTTQIAATIHYSSYIVDETKAVPKYLWYYFRSEIFQRLLIQSLPNGIKTEIKPTRLLKLEISLPPVSEQIRIVSVIDTLMNKLTEAWQQRNLSIKSTESLFEAYLQKLMSQYPVTGTFSEVIKFKPRSGPSFPTNPEGKGKPVLMPSSVSGFGVDVAKVEHGLGNEKISDKDLLQTGDILIARGNKPNQVGNAGVVPEAAEGWVCANLLMRVQVDLETVDPFFCVYWLQTPTMRRHVKENMKGTSPTIQKINQQTMLNYPYPVNVPIHAQHQVVSCLNTLQMRIDELKHLQMKTGEDIRHLISPLLKKTLAGEL